MGFIGIRGTEGLEVDFEVTRAYVETSPRLLNFGIEYFQQKKTFRVVSCGFVESPELALRQAQRP